MESEASSDDSADSHQLDTNQARLEAGQGSSIINEAKTRSELGPSAVDEGTTKGSTTINEASTEAGQGSSFINEGKRANGEDHPMVNAPPNSATEPQFGPAQDSTDCKPAPIPANEAEMEGGDSPKVMIGPQRDERPSRNVPSSPPRWAPRGARRPLPRELETDWVRNDGYSYPFKRAPTVQDEDGRPMTLFFTKAYCFSNHFPCEKLVIEGTSYSCTEQFYMYYKARVFGDQRAATEIMRCLNPGDMKRIGARVRGFNQEQWYPVSIYVMLVASTAKYRQNARLRQELFSTAPSLMVEAAPFDRRWGCGVGMDSDAIKERRRWPGKNLLGRMLTLVRDQLIAEEKGDCVIRRPIEVKKEEVGKDDEKKAKLQESRRGKKSSSRSESRRERKKEKKRSRKRRRRSSSSSSDEDKDIPPKTSKKDNLEPGLEEAMDEKREDHGNVGASESNKRICAQ